jgi:hypothetical protein
VWITQWEAPQTQERVRRSPNDELSTFVNGVEKSTVLNHRGTFASDGPALRRRAVDAPSRASGTGWWSCSGATCGKGRRGQTTGRR